MEEIRVQVVESHKDCSLNFTVGSKIMTNQMFLQLSQDRKITWCEVRAEERVFLVQTTGNAVQITSNRSPVWFFGRGNRFLSLPSMQPNSYITSEQVGAFT
ncbi:hypothetical protein HNY73_010166 [Argiope bruennichi]|uniref:Uncharacterized protein n=1 Tax=Argiope bruennichi TaxID=94029 RepID=A0A8T0F093_ARGBR|nr:hypothetical protein HNY73_010166 [Argiope bruennichi]